jgi:hypothetical protein
MIKTLLKSLCFSNLWISFAAGINYYAYSLRFHDTADVADGALVFFSTLFLYNVQRIWLLPYPPTGDERHAWINDNLTVLKVLAFIGFAVCVVLSFTLPLKQVLIGGVLALISVAYSFIPGKKPLRALGLLKTFLVAIVWALVIFFFTPFDWLINASLTKEFVRFVVLVYLLTLFFEYRDKKTDTEATLPKLLTNHQFAIVLFVLTGIVVGLDAMNGQYVLLITDTALLPIVIWRNFKKPKAIFYSFVVDGFLIVNALGVLFEMS